MIFLDFFSFQVDPLRSDPPFATSAFVSFDIFVFHLETRLPLSTMYLFTSRTRSSYFPFVFPSI